jgi:hypothetical protein
VIDTTEILARWHAGRSQYDMAGSPGPARGTIRRYLEPANAAGFVPDGTPPMSQPDWEPLVKQWFPYLTDTRRPGLRRASADLWARRKPRQPL